MQGTCSRRSTSKNSRVLALRVKPRTSWSEVLKIGSDDTLFKWEVDFLSTSDQEVRGSTPGAKTHHNVARVSGITIIGDHY